MIMMYMFIVKFYVKYYIFLFLFWCEKIKNYLIDYLNNIWKIKNIKYKNIIINNILTYYLSLINIKLKK